MIKIQCTDDLPVSYGDWDILTAVEYLVDKIKTKDELLDLLEDILPYYIDKLTKENECAHLIKEINSEDW